MNAPGHCVINYIIIILLLTVRQICFTVRFPNNDFRAISES